MRTAIRVLALCGVIFIAAFAVRVLVPYYQQQQDGQARAESQDHVRAIIGAIDRFVEQNPEHRFPTNVSEVTPLIALATNNLEAVYSRFVYLPPPPQVSQKELFGRVVLIEKLGHYKHKVGGYEGKAGGVTPGWYSLAEYKALAEKNGVSLEQLSEHQK
jgi:hypothetical protein